MIRVLFIARYRDRSMSKKLALLAQAPDLSIRHIMPNSWKDDLLRVEQTSETRDGVEQIAVPMIGTPSDPHRAFYRTLHFTANRFQPRVIHAEEEPDSLAALQIALAKKLYAPNAKLILHTWQNVARPLNHGVRALLRVTLKNADAIHCANNEAIFLLTKMGYAGNKILLPAIGVDTDVFYPMKMERHNKNEFVIGFVGRINLDKGLDVLIESVRLLRQDLSHAVKLKMIGDGPDATKIRALVEEKGLSDLTEFVSPVPSTTLANVMQTFDVLALPSRSTEVWKEQFGRVLTEAMACGIPVVGSDSGAIPEVVGDASMIFPEGDALALARLLFKLATQPGLRSEQSARGVARVRLIYSQTVIASKTAQHYRRIVASD
jgi:glycosyltransferase involved in cell wall biosynthesis